MGRIDEAMNADEAGRRYKEDQDERVNRRIAERLEAADRDQKPDEGEPVQATMPEHPEAPNMCVGGSSAQASGVNCAGSEAGMNQDAGLSSGVQGSGTEFPGPQESGEPYPTGSAGGGQAVAPPTTSHGGPTH